MFKCSRTPDLINPLQVSRRRAVTQAVCCVLFLAQPGGPGTHHCIASLIYRRSADAPTLTRHHDQTPKSHWAPLLRVRCVRRNTYHVVGVIGLLVINKKPWKQNTIINISYITKQLQYHNYNTIHNTIYTVDIKYPSFIHHAYILNMSITYLTHP